MKEFELATIHSGFAAGPVFDADLTRVKTNPSAEQTESDNPEHEMTLYNRAVDSLDRELASAAEKADRNSRDIYETERLLLKDNAFSETVRELITEKNMNVNTAVEHAGNVLAQKLAGNENAYIRQRSSDITGVTERLLEILRGEGTNTLKVPSIIVSEELNPARLSAIDPSLILGLVTEKGSMTSHVSILAGNMGIPYLYGSRESLDAVRASEKAIIDDKKLITDPDEKKFGEALRRMWEENERKQSQKRRQKEDSASIDEKIHTKVYANIAGTQDIPKLIASGVRGVGLFRSEFLFLDHNGAPSEEEQFEAYKSVAEAMDGKETVIRTMDLGSDKKTNWLPMPDEKNPALGCRGLRLSLKEQDLFRTQLRALLRAAVFGNIKIMLPMVTSVREVETVRSILENCAEELSNEGIAYKIPSLGIMIETPAAAMIADELAKAADFFSIGTNDLTQYTLALDREAQGLEAFYDPYHEAIFRLIKITADAGHKNNIPTSVCGELAGQPNAVKRLIECGVDKLSVSLSKVDETRLQVVKAEAELKNRRLGKDAEQSPYIAAPADGRLIPMEDIPDPVFSAGTLGECVGIMPDSGIIYAPCDGIVTGIAQTGHAITFTASDGREILVHVGINTVTLGGRGFKVLVQEGNTVSKGEIVMEVDLAVITEAGLSPMVITAFMS